MLNNGHNVIEIIFLVNLLSYTSRTSYIKYL